jgi:hypothetical protein
MQGVGGGALEALGLAADFPLKYVCFYACCGGRVVEEGGCRSRAFLRVGELGSYCRLFLFPCAGNIITAAAFARFVHLIVVGCEHLKGFNIDREFNVSLNN